MTQPYGGDFAALQQAVVLDTETTGVNVKTDRILTLAATKIAFTKVPGGQTPLRELNLKMNPGIPVPEGATRIHGIRDADVAHAPPFAEKAEEIRAFLGNLPVICHNAEYDMGILNAEFQRAGLPALENPHYCTMKATARIQSTGQDRRAKWPKLEEAANHFGIQGRAGEEHGAREDVQIAARIAGRIHQHDRRRKGGKYWAWIVCAAAALLIIVSC